MRAGLQAKRFIRSGALVPDLVEQQARRFKQRSVFLYEDTSWSFADLVARMNAVANALRGKSGFEPGRAVALLGASQPAYVATWLGLARAGCVPALLNSNLRGEALIRCVEAAEAVVLVYGAELAAAVAEVHDDLTASGCRLFRYGASPDGDLPRVVDLDRLTAAASPEWSAGSFNRVSSDSLLYIFTSGTTGLPKPAIITHIRFFLMALAFRVFFNISPDDVLYVTLPLYHSAGGCVGVGNAIMFGCTAAIRSRFSASAFWTDCARYNVTVSFTANLPLIHR